MGRLLLTALPVLAGICLYAAAHHFRGGLRPHSLRVHTWFAVLSVLVAGYVLAKVGSYSAASASALVAARRTELGCAILVFGVLPRFVAEYCGLRARRALFALGVLWAALFAANLMLPFGLAYAVSPPYGYLVLPWGERITNITLGQGGAGYLAAWGAVLLTFVFCGYACAYEYRRHIRARAVSLAAALGVFLAFVLFNLVVNAGLVKFTHTGEFGFIAIVLLMSVALDKELRVTRDAQMRSEKRFRALADQAADAIYLHDLQGRLMDVNPQACLALGYAREELLSMRVSDFEAQVDIERAQSIWNGMQPGIPLTVEGQHRRKDGSVFPVEARIGLFETEGHRWVLAIVRDITERRLAETALRESIERLRTILELEPECVKVLGPDGALLEMNRAGLAMIEADSIEQVRGHAVIDIVAPAYRAGFAALSRRVLQGGSGQFEFEIVGLKGARRWLETHAVPLRDGKTGKVTLLGVTRDVTAQKRADENIRALNAELEQRVRERTAQLEAANRELEAFSYSVSHDLRAPLRAVDGFSQALLEDYGDRLDGAARNYLERVRAGAQNMGALIDDMLKLSRVTRAPLQPEPVDVSALAREIIAQHRAREPARQVSVDIAPGMRCHADPGLLRVALENLLDNAWKYTGKTPRAAIAVGWDAQGGDAVFYVRDNGAGFDMQHAGKLFGAFQRLHRKDEFEGTGIGLATVQRIVHRHAGQVWAEATPGAGAAFYFTLGVPAQ